MNCQHESEHEGHIQPTNNEQQPMEILDYLRLASFIHYQHNPASEPLGALSAGVAQA